MTNTTFTSEVIERLTQGRNRMAEHILENSFDLYIDAHNQAYASLVQDSVMIKASRSALVESTRLLKIASKETRSLVAAGQASLLELCSNSLYSAAEFIELKDSNDPLVGELKAAAKHLYDNRSNQLNTATLESLANSFSELSQNRRENQFVKSVIDVLSIQVETE